MNSDELKRRLIEYVSFALAGTSFICMLASTVFSCMILLGMLKGEWAFLHLLTMLLVSGMFAVIFGVCLAVHDTVMPEEVIEECE